MRGITMTERMKKTMGLAAFGLAGALFLSGCGNESGGGDEKESTSSKEQTYQVGITQFVEHPSLDAATEGFKKALEDEGINVEYDEQNANNDQNNVQTIANNFAGDGVDLIFANATPSAQAALNATKDIPIVFTSVTDPIGAGFVKSFDKPGKNITGTTDNHPDATKKTISFITDEVKAKNVGVIFNSGEQNSEVQVKEVKKLVEEKGAKLVEASVSNTSEVKQAAESLVGRVDAI